MKSYDHRTPDLCPEVLVRKGVESDSMERGQSCAVADSCSCALASPGMEDIQFFEVSGPNKYQSVAVLCGGVRRFFLPLPRKSLVGFHASKPIPYTLNHFGQCLSIGLPPKSAHFLASIGWTQPNI